MTQNRQDPAPKKSPVKRRAGGAAKAPVKADQVAEFLRQNPEFFDDFPDLLAVLKAPARDVGDGVIDLRQHMVERLRGELADIATARDELVATGRTNLAAQARVHKAVLALLRARNFEQFIEMLTVDLAVVLDLDVVTIGVEKTEDGPATPCTAGVLRLDPDTVERVMGPGQNIVLRSEVPGDPAIFGEGAGLVASDAMIRLSIGSTAPAALLALGSRDPDQFHPGQGTELLGFLARVVESCIRGWLNIPE